MALEVGTDVERQLLIALKSRYPADADTEDFGPFNDGFVEALRPIYLSNPEDLDVVSLLPSH